MVEAVFIERAVGLVVAMFGGAASILVLSTFWSAYHTWRQTKELENQRELLELQLEAVIVLLQEVRGGK